MRNYERIGAIARTEAEARARLEACKITRPKVKAGFYCLDLIEVNDTITRMEYFSKSKIRIRRDYAKRKKAKTNETD